MADERDVFPGLADQVAADTAEANREEARELLGITSDLLPAARAVLELLEEDAEGYVSTDTPYRAWFKDCEGTFVSAMRLRRALGMEFPEDVRDIAPALLAEEPWAGSDT